MALTPTQSKDAYQFFIVAFGAAPGVEYMSQLNDAYGAGMTTEQIVNVYTTKPQFEALYPRFLTNEQFANRLIENVVGASATAEAKTEAKEQVVSALNAGMSKGDVIFNIFKNLSDKPEGDSMHAAGQMLANKVAVAQYLTEVKLVNETDLAKLQAPLAGVTATSDVSTPAKIDAIVAGAPAAGANTLTVGADHISATAEGQTFTAPILQNQNGAVTNTLESGDVIAAVGTGNKLVADITWTTSGGIPVGPSIGAATNNVQVVELRAQTPNTDLGGVHPNFSTIDAQNFNGVEQWWTVNSRSDIQIEDVRSRPEETTIGMRNTDPEVGFRVYFDPEQLTNEARAEDSALTLRLDDITKPGNLTDVPVNAVSFTLGGELYALRSDAIGAATTHAELVTALQAAIAAQPALAGVTVTLNANTTITLQDPTGRVFEKGAWGFIDNVVPADGNIVFQQTVGNPSLVDEPITTNVVLDNVGRTSVGGGLDIGSLGEGGVEQFNVSVDRSSWLTNMESTSHLWDGVYAEERHLEIVNFKSIGAKGDLTVGARAEALAQTPDGRVSNGDNGTIFGDVAGLTDVRVINGTDFAGKLNLGIELTDNVDARYLAGATAPVQFSFDGSKQNDIFNVNVDSDIAGDPDFRLGINMGAGDDRLILATSDNKGVLKNISVDGGTGNNTFVTATTVGKGADLEFKSFTNFQNYEIEGGDTEHDFTTLNGVTSVVVATNGGANNNLIDLAANNGIVISGKNQTTGNNSNANQGFGKIDVQGAEGATLAVKLDNTARIGGTGAGKLTVADLSVTDLPGNQSAVRTLNIESAGRRETTNQVTSIKAEKVGTFNFTGTQALTVGLDAAANAAGVSALVVDATALAAAFTLNVASDIVNDVDANKTASFKAGASTKDALNFAAGVNTTAKTSVSGFETVSFKGGSFNAVNTTGVTLYKTDGAAAGLKLSNLQGVENVELGSYNATTTVGVNGGGAQTFQTNAVSNSSALNLTVKSAFAGTQEINTKGYTTLNLKLDTLAGQPAAQKDFDLNLEKVAVDGADASVAVTSGGAVAYANAAAVPVTDFTKSNLTNVVVTGGASSATTAAANFDRLDLNTLAPTVKLLDVSGYKGVVTATIGDALQTTVGTTTFTTGNTVVKVGAFGVNVTDTEHTAALVPSVTTFEFTADAAKAATGDANFQWTIDKFAGINEAGATLSNLSVLDVSALGIKGLADMVMTQDGTDTVIQSNTTHNFEIVLVGQNVVDLDLANFKFAA